MKKWYSGIIIGSLFMLLILRYGAMNFISENYVGNDSIFVHTPKNVSQVISTDVMISSLFSRRNFSNEEQPTLQTWDYLKNLIKDAHVLPNAVDAIKEAGSAWNNLVASIQEERFGLQRHVKENRCPFYFNKRNASVLDYDTNGYKLRVPCGLTQGSSITVFGIPTGLLGNFRIDLTGEASPWEPGPPIILHYDVRLHGDNITEDSFLVQNSWTVGKDWGNEERCPNPDPDKNQKVDKLDRCNKIVGEENKQIVMASMDFNSSRNSSTDKDISKTRKYFPFQLGYPFVATLRVGSEGIQMTVDGKHITSFAYRQNLEPWLVSEVRVSGDLKLFSVMATGLPISEVSEHIINLEALKSAPLPPRKPLDLFIGVVSTSNNFKRRMAVRRTWMQYAGVKSGKVAVRFFVGLHKNQMVNEQVWKEAQTYGDTQLMPFVDYYSLISWKTLAICIFGTEVVSAKFIMKTDDDALVRVDQVLASLNSLNVTNGLLYGLINSDSRPHRNPDSKWYISTQEWPEETYPPWAHGPGYVVSRDIANAIYASHKKGSLKMFKLEDVAMGIWIADIKKGGLEVRYEKDERIVIEGCKDDFVVAHYQSPNEMLCLWQKLQETKHANCCRDR